MTAESATPKQLWSDGEPVAAAARIRSELDEMRPHDIQQLSRWISSLDPEPGFERVPIVILRTITVEPYLPILRVRAFSEGMLVEPELAGFGQIEQGIEQLAGSLPEARAAILIWRLEEIAPRLINEFLDLEEADVEKEIEGARNRFAAIVESIRKLSSAHLIAELPRLDSMPQLGIIDPLEEKGQAAAVDRLNRGLAEVARSDGSITLIDEEQWMKGISRFDPTSWMTARLPYSWSALDALARAHVTALRALCGRSRKCVVLDLDNTLWKGVIGDDGLSGIALEPEGSGLPYYEFQQYLRTLSSRGVILALASRNDRQTALEAIDRHPHMLLRSDAFSTTEIHWEDKVSSLRRIAASLNIGLDSLVYVDDSPFECALVRSELPEVMTIAAASPYEAMKKLDRLRPFDTLSFTSEDRKRTETYLAQQEREELRTASSTIDDFLAGLDMSMKHEIVSPGDPHWKRAVQLINKTNQFNLTGERISEARLAELVESGAAVHTFSLSDRFGDNGVISVVVTIPREPEIEIMSFVMSCRVIGRKVEDAIIALLTSLATDRKKRRLIGHYRPTERNSLVADLWERVGFDPGTEEGSWTLELPSSLTMPEVIRVEPPAGE